MRKLFLALTASMAVALAACGPGADQPIDQQPPPPAGDPAQPGDPGAPPADDMGTPAAP